MNRSLNCASSSKKKWCQTNYEQRRGSLIWKIRGFSLCSLSNAKCLSSSRFGISGESDDWGLELFPNGMNEESREFISVRLVSRIVERSFDDDSEDLSDDKQTTCSISVVDVHGEKVHAIEYIYDEQTPDAKYIARKDLLGSNTLLPNDQLTISCDLTVTNRTDNEGSPDSTGIKLLRMNSRFGQGSLSGDLGKLLYAKTHSDVWLILNGHKLWLHKSLLAARSTTFEAMFRHAMVESVTNTVTINDVDTDVMEELLRFVYTDSCSYPSVDFALQVLASADKYDISALKIHCADYLRSNMSADSVIQVLVAADAHGVASLREECIDFICRELSYLMTVVPSWKSQFHQCPNVLCEILERLESRFFL